MRLIDADKMDGNDCFTGIEDFDIYASEIFDDYIRKQPTVDAAPVVHGRWIEKTIPIGTREYECSVCHHNENKHTVIKGCYCWYCGAKMDGDNE